MMEVDAPSNLPLETQLQTALADGDMKKALELVEEMEIDLEVRGGGALMLEMGSGKAACPGCPVLCRWSQNGPLQASTLPCRWLSTSSTGTCKSDAVTHYRRALRTRWLTVAVDAGTTPATCGGEAVTD